MQNLMDSNCIQYRVTGGGGGGGGEGGGGGGSLSYRVVSQDSEQPNGTSVNPSSIGNVQVQNLLFNILKTLIFFLLTQAVLASPLNGQFYVIGNPSDVLGGMGQRTIAPRAGPFALEPNSVQAPKEDRQGWVQVIVKIQIQP